MGLVGAWYFYSVSNVNDINVVRPEAGGGVRPPYSPAGSFSTSNVPHYPHKQAGLESNSSFHTVSLLCGSSCLFYAAECGACVFEAPTTPKVVTPLRLVLAPRPNQPEEFFELLVFITNPLPQ